MNQLLPRKNNPSLSQCTGSLCRVVLPKAPSREAGKKSLQAGKTPSSLSPIPYPSSSPSPMAGSRLGTDLFIFFPDILQASGHSLPELILRGCFFHPRLNLSGFGDCRIRRFLQQGVLQIPFFPPWKFRVQISVFSPLPRGLCISPIPPSSSLLRRGREEKKISKQKPPVREKKVKKIK